MKSTNCPVCGTACWIEGNTTKYYSPKWQHESDIAVVMQVEYNKMTGEELGKDVAIEMARAVSYLIKGE